MPGVPDFHHVWCVWSELLASVVENMGIIYYVWCVQVCYREYGNHLPCLVCSVWTAWVCYRQYGKHFHDVCVFCLSCLGLLQRVWETLSRSWCVLSELLGSVTESMGNTFTMFVCSVWTAGVCCREYGKHFHYVCVFCLNCWRLLQRVREAEYGATVWLVLSTCQHGKKISV